MAPRAISPHSSPDEGLGIALKIADGDSHSRTANRRARLAVLLTLLKELKLLDGAAEKKLTHLFEIDIVDSRGKVVGRIRPCPPLAGPMVAPAPRASSQDAA